MPDRCYFGERVSELQRVVSGAHPADQRDYTMRTNAAFMIKKEKSHPSSVTQPKLFDWSSSPDHADRGCCDASAEIIGAELAPSVAQSPKKPRAKESSRHFGVRFRPDLHKWVAEIRVAEWKLVDKKVWLGTFDSEEGAARAVDAARKLLKCKKKRLPNFPCADLDAYSEQIPAHLNLTNLRNESMFKDVTVFIKRKAQEYAAKTCPNVVKPALCISITSDEELPANYNLDVNSRHAVEEETQSMACFSNSSYNNTEQISPMDDDWASLSTYSYNSCSAPSSAGSSPELAQSSQWLYFDNPCYDCNRAQEMEMSAASGQCFEERSIEGGAYNFGDHVGGMNSTLGAGDPSIWESDLNSWPMSTDATSSSDQILQFSIDDDQFGPMMDIHFVPGDEDPLQCEETSHNVQAYNSVGSDLFLQADWAQLQPNLINSTFHSRSVTNSMVLC